MVLKMQYWKMYQQARCYNSAVKIRSCVAVQGKGEMVSKLKRLELGDPIYLLKFQKMNKYRREIIRYDWWKSIQMCIFKNIMFRN